MSSHARVCPRESLLNGRRLAAAPCCLFPSALLPPRLIRLLSRRGSKICVPFWSREDVSDAAKQTFFVSLLLELMGQSSCAVPAPNSSMKEVSHGEVMICKYTLEGRVTSEQANELVSCRWTDIWLNSITSTLRYQKQ